MIPKRWSFTWGKFYDRILESREKVGKWSEVVRPLFLRNQTYGKRDVKGLITSDLHSHVKSPTLQPTLSGKTPIPFTLWVTGIHFHLFAGCSSLVNPSLSLHSPCSSTSRPFRRQLQHRSTQWTRRRALLASLTAPSLLVSLTTWSMAQPCQRSARIYR